jgi:poly(A) polymerase
MAGDTPVQYGVTPPISTEPSSQREHDATNDMIACLKSFGQFEPEEESRKRTEVLARLSDIIQEFVRRVSLKRGMPEAVARETTGKLYTFGSYRLGVHGTGADIDTLCVAPRHVRREDFFQEMFQLLEEQGSDIEDLSPVPDAFVPVIKFIFQGIPVSSCGCTFTQFWACFGGSSRYLFLCPDRFGVCYREPFFGSREPGPPRHKNSKGLGRRKCTIS